MSLNQLILALLALPFILLFNIQEFIERPNRDSLIGSAYQIEATGFRWDRKADIPFKRYEFGGARVGDFIYLVGGLSISSVYFPNNKVEAYDIKNNQWKDVAPLPIPVHHPGITSDGQNLYMIGGNGIRIIPYSYAYSYNPQTNQWQRLKDMPTKRGALGLTYLDGKIYAIGGADNNAAKDSNEVYDIKLKKWDQLKPMPTAREHLSVVAAGKKIYALGGFNNTRFNSLKSFEVYDPSKNEWAKLKDLPLPISGSTAAATSDSIFIFGGQQGWPASAEVLEYIISQDRWVRRPNLPTPRYASVTVTAADGIHVFGGNEVVGGYQFLKDHLLLKLPQE